LIAPFEPSVRTFGSMPRLAPLCERVARRGDEHELVVGELPPREPVVVRDAPGDRHVHRVVEHAPEHHLAVAHLEADLHVRMALAKGLDQLRDEVLAGRRDGADAERGRLLLGGLPRRPDALLEQAEHVGGVGDVGRTARRGAQRSAGALGQANAELALEGRHRGRDGRLGDHELLGGGGDRAAAYDGQEGDQLGKSHGHASGPMYRAKA
jgi:hypothetical protein